MLSSTVRKMQYDKGAGWAASYAIPFKFWAEAEITAVLSYDDGTADDTLTISTDYTLTAPGDSGTLTRVGTWDAAAVRLTIYRTVEITQETDYRDGEAIPANTIETDLDRLSAVEQEIWERQSRALAMPITDPDTLDMTIPPLSERIGGMILGFDQTTGEPKLFSEPGSYPASPFMGTVIDDPTASAALATLTSTKTLSNESYTVLDGDGYTNIILSATTLTGERTVTLPTAADNINRRLRVSTLNAHGTYNLVVDGKGSETINGTLSVTLAGPYQYVDMLCDGSTWIVQAMNVYIEKVDSTSRTQAAPISSDQWYSPGSITLAITPGVWEIGFQEHVCVRDTTLGTAVFMVLSVCLSATQYGGPYSYFMATMKPGMNGTGMESHYITISGKRQVTIAADVTLWLNTKGLWSGGGSMEMLLINNVVPAVISARRIG